MRCLFPTLPERRPCQARDERVPAVPRPLLRSGLQASLWGRGAAAVEECLMHGAAHGICGARSSALTNSSSPAASSLALHCCPPLCSPGTDLSWYKNIPVPTSYMACGSGAPLLDA